MIGEPVAVGVLALAPLEESSGWRGETPGGTAAQAAEATLWNATGPGDLDLIVAMARWSNGERSIEVSERRDSPERFDQLVGRMRMSIERATNCWVTLKQA